MKNYTTNRSKTTFGNLIIIALLFGSILQTNAQLAAPSWVAAFGSVGGSYEQGNGIVAGSDGNIYVGSRYAGSPNFGVTGHQITATGTGGSTWVSCTKLTSSLYGVWSTATSPSGFNYGGSIGIDNRLNTYTLGIINSGSSWFCTKTSPAGAILYQYVCNHSINNWNNPNGVCIDNGGNAYVCGGYNPTTVIGAHTLTYLGSGADGFVFQLSPTGSPRWAIPLHGSGCDIIAYGDALDTKGNLWVCGEYTGTPTFGTAPALPTSAGNSLFVVELDTTNGNVKNVYTAANAGYSALQIGIDPVNSIYVAGTFSGTGTWGSFSFGSGGTTQGYVAKLLPNGKFQWVMPTGGTANNIHSSGISIDKNWDVTVDGSFSGTATFGTTSVTATATANAYVARYASGNGAFMWVQTATGTGQSSAYYVTTDANRQTYITGTYANVPVFGTTFLPTGGGTMQNIYVAKLDSSLGLGIVPSPQLSYCAGQTSILPYTAVYDSANGDNGNFRPGNVFTAQLSDATGSFAAGGTFLGSVASLTSGNINITIPSGTTASTKYLIRIESSKPAYCSIVALDTITINSSLTLNITPTNPTVCNGSSITLKETSGGVGTTYVWSGNASTVDSAVMSPTTTTPVTVSATGVCSGTTTFTITVNPVPTVTVSALPTAICPGGSTTLSTGGVGSTSYSWSSGGTTSSVSVSPVSSTAEYVLTGTNAAGCSAKDSLTVTINPLPTISVLPANPEICNGSSTGVKASGAGATGNYKWTPTYGLSNPLIDSTVGSPTLTTTYTVVGTTVLGCVDSTVVTLTVNSSPVPSLSTMQAICAGGSTTLTASGGTGYTWAPVKGLSSSTVAAPSASPAVSTQYTVTVSNGTCQATDTVTVAVNSLPTLSVIGTATILIGESTPIGVNTPAGNTYTWSPVASLSCNTCANPVASPTTTTSYTVTVTNGSNCSDTAAVQITVKELCGPVYVPNAFSPNSESANDKFKVYGNCIKGLELTVYDRWGNEVYQTTNPAVEWDGTSKGRILNTGTYVYTLSVTDADNNVMSKKGNITLLR